MTEYRQHLAIYVFMRKYNGALHCDTYSIHNRDIIYGTAGGGAFVGGCPCDGGCCGGCDATGGTDVAVTVAAAAVVGTVAAELGCCAVCGATVVVGPCVADGGTGAPICVTDAVSFGIGLFTGVAI